MPPAHLFTNFQQKLIQRLLQEQEQWILWFPVALGIGILIYFQLSQEPACWLGPGISLFMGGMTFFLYNSSSQKMLGRLGTHFLFYITLGFSAAQIRTLFLATVLLNTPQPAKEMQGIIQSVEVRPTSVRLTLKEIVFQEASLATLKGTVRLTLRGRLAKASTFLQPGQKIQLTAMLLPPQGPVAPGAYDFRRRAYFEGLSAVGYATTIPEILDQPLPRWQDPFDRLRHSMTFLFRQHLPETEGAVAASLITGDRSGLSESTRQTFADSGLAHILAISGLHLSIMAGLAFFSVRRGLSLCPALALYWPIKKIAAGVALLLTFGYLLLSGMTIPAQRAFMMTSLMLLGILFDRQTMTLRNVALAAAVILLLRPESLLFPSFQMSFAAVIFLIAGYQVLQKRGTQVTSTGQRLRLYLGGIVVSTILATLATTPYILYTFNRLTVHAIPANLVAIPILSFLLMPLLLIFLGSVALGGEVYITPLLALVLNVLLSLATEIASWPGSVVTLPALSSSALGLCTLAGLWMAFWKTSWRWAGSLGIMVSLGMMMFQSLPDIYILPKKKLIIFSVNSKELWVNSKRSGRFAREVWQRQRGGGVVRSWHKEKAAFFKKQGTDLLIYYPQGEVIIQEYVQSLTSDWSCRLIHRSTGQSVDFNSFSKKGGHVFWVTSQGFKIHRVEEEVGNRPWS